MCRVVLHHYTICDDVEDPSQVPLSSARWKPCAKPTGGLRFYRCEQLQTSFDNVESKCQVCVEDEIEAAREKEQKAQEKLAKLEFERNRRDSVRYALRNAKDNGTNGTNGFVDKDHAPD